MKEIYGVLDAVFDDHSPSIAANKLGWRSLELVCEEQSGLFVSEIGDGDLPDGALVVGKGDRSIQNPRRAIGSGNGLELDASPRRDRFVSNFRQKVSVSSAQRDETNAHPIELIEVLVGGELGVKDELARERSGAFFPEIDEAKDFVVLSAFSNFSIGVAEDARISILSQKSKDSLLSSAAF